MGCKISGYGCKNAPLSIRLFIRHCVLLANSVPNDNIWHEPTKFRMIGGDCFYHCKVGCDEVK